MKNKHTQGQWIYKIEGFKISIGNEKTGSTTTAHDYKICEIDDNSMQAEANAKLIAASPELLEVLNKIKLALLLSSELDKSYWSKIAQQAIDKATK